MWASWHQPDGRHCEKSLTRQVMTTTGSSFTTPLTRGPLATTGILARACRPVRPTALGMHHPGQWAAACRACSPATVCTASGAARGARAPSCRCCGLPTAMRSSGPLWAAPTGAVSTARPGAAAPTATRSTPRPSVVRLGRRKMFEMVCSMSCDCDGR